MDIEQLAKISRALADPTRLRIYEAIAAREPLRRLTPRQIQVMRLATQGYRSREIAGTLKLSEKTVEHHRHQLMRRLGLDSYADLVRYAVRVGVTLAASSAL